MNANVTSKTEQTGYTYTPPVPWSKLNADEKIARMHEIIKNNNSSIYRLERRIDTLNEILRNHSHVEGKIVKTISAFEDLGPKSYPSCSLSNDIKCGESEGAYF